MTQKQIVLSHLRKNNSITSWFAIQNYGMTRLADIILRLRKEGHNIETKIMKHKNMRTGKRLISLNIPTANIRRLAQIMGCVSHNMLASKRGSGFSIILTDPHILRSTYGK